jgi:hypothetical protein
MQFAVHQTEAPFCFAPVQIVAIVLPVLRARLESTRDGGATAANENLRPTGVAEFETVACRHKKMPPSVGRRLGPQVGRENSQGPLRLAGLRTDQGDCNKIIPGHPEAVCTVSHIRRSEYSLNFNINNRM